MEDPIEKRLRDLMRGDQTDELASAEDARLERVMHKVHMQGGVFDLISLFARWGWVLSEGGSRGVRHARPARRHAAPESRSDPTNN